LVILFDFGLASHRRRLFAASADPAGRFLDIYKEKLMIMKAAGKNLAVLSLSLALITGFATAPLLAQRRPDIGQMTREAESARPGPRPSSQDSGLTPETQSTGPIQMGGPTMAVRDFIVEGAGDIRQKDVDSVLAPYKGRDLTMGQIQEAADRVTDLCRRKGYILALAYLPVQEAISGVVTIRVALGQYGEVSIDNKSLLRDSTVRSFLDSQLQKGAPITQKELERAVFLIGDLPGTQAPRLHLAPGAEPGTSNILVETEAERRLGGYFLTDNQGSRYTGRYRFNAGLDIRTPFGIGDKLSVYGLVTDTGNLSNAGFDYSVPLGSHGLKLSLGYGRVFYKLGKEFEFLEAEGWSDTFTGALAYPIVRSSERNVWLALRASHKKMRDEIHIADYIEKKKIFAAALELKHEAWHQLGSKMLFTDVTAGFTAGRLSYNDPDQAQANRLGVNSAGDFAHINLGLSGRLSLTENFSINAAAQFQKALNRNLDSAEQFLVTGATGVKGYREVISGDDGYLLTAMFRYRLPEFKDGLDHSLGLFIEHGGWRYQDDNWLDKSAKRSDTLTDIGLGYSFYLDPVVLNVQVARTIGPWPEELRYDGRTHVLANIGVFF
jgi:hemolysin activation/secretion protein